MVEKAQNATGSGNMKDLYDISKKVLNETVRKSLTVKAKDGMILSTVEEQLERWREHFSEVFNNNNTVDNCKKEQYSRTSGTKRISLMIVKKELLLRFPRVKVALVDEKLHKEQAGFRPNRSCVDQINSLRIIIEQSIEWNSQLYFLFVDYETENASG